MYTNDVNLQSQVMDNIKEQSECDVGLTLGNDANELPVEMELISGVTVGVFGAYIGT